MLWSIQDRKTCLWGTSTHAFDRQTNGDAELTLQCFCLWPKLSMVVLSSIQHKPLSALQQSSQTLTGGRQKQRNAKVWGPRNIATQNIEAHDLCMQLLQPANMSLLDILPITEKENASSLSAKTEPMANIWHTLVYCDHDFPDFSFPLLIILKMDSGTFWER